MHISFSPQCNAQTLVVSKVGDVLTINGEEFGFGSLPEGATIPQGAVPCPWIAGPVERIGGVLHINLLLPYKVGCRHVDAPPPLINPPDGMIALPNLDPDVELSDVDA